MTKLSVTGSPDHEHTRSPAARTVASLAQASGLFLSHFEHRLALPTPPTWTDGERRAPPEFVGGVLSESKYQAFRHDCLVASFHPGHRAKWTAHELCHGLVGFAYQSGSTSLFQAIAAWLAELLPVALWYFFDEAGVQRCADHQWGGPIFQRHCDACEEAAKRGSRRLGPDDRKWMQDGRAFVERELAAIARSRKLGRPQGSLHASIDLASDGLAYAHAHGPRLRAPEMERFVSQFFGPRQGHHPTLESLEARVVELCSALSEGKKAQPWQTTRWDFVAQDLGYRLLTLRAQCEIHGSALDAIIDGLAGQRSRAGVARAIRDYRTLYAAHPRGRARAALFAPEDLFAVGYALPDGMGSSHTQVAQGIGSACPNAFHALGKQRARVVESFCVDDRAERVPLGRRFAAWLARN